MKSSNSNSKERELQQSETSRKTKKALPLHGMLRLQLEKENLHEVKAKTCLEVLRTQFKEFFASKGVNSSDHLNQCGYRRCNFSSLPGLRWIPTEKDVLPICTTKVDSEPPNGSNEDITNPYECDQTLNVSAGTLNLSAGTSFNPNKEDSEFGCRKD
ncbi:hypothetical protein Tco_0924346 [Tanacetum coccineum]|uniref:Uncharacterized protein n=1 Tax=Tanacetum coccineum TaxID=301880 RepID=A0ABQ5D4L7_9ASTR